MDIELFSNKNYMVKKVIPISLAFLLITTNPISAEARMFGKETYLSVAISDGQCAYIRHYYRSYFFWVVTEEGYYDELVGCI